MRDQVSIVIVNWNGKKWLKKCLDSLLEQTYKNIEIIVVDNDSNDDSVEYLKRNYPQVKVIESKENLGFAGGNNLGIKNAKGNLVLLINNDTWVEKDFLTELVDFYNRNKYDLVAPSEAKYDGEKRDPYITRIDPLGHPIYLEGKAYKQEQNFYLSGVCVLFSKDLYQTTKGLDNNFFMYFEEIDWFWRLNLLNKKSTHVDSIYIYHAGAGSTGKGIKYLSFLWRNQNTLQMLLKNYSWYNLVWVVPLYLIQNLIEFLFFLIILKPKIAMSYPLGIWFNIKYLNRTLQKRKWIQEHRKVGDRKIMGKMYLGPGKLKHLLNFLRT